MNDVALLKWLRGSRPNPPNSILIIPNLSYVTSRVSIDIVYDKLRLRANQYSNICFPENPSFRTPLQPFW